jgi:predicted permease
MTPADLVRPLRQSPRFAALTILLVALGIGACTAVFTLFDSLLLRDRPGVRDNATLVDVGRTQRGSGFDNFSYPDFLAYRRGNSTLTDLAVLRFEPESAGVAVAGDAQAANVSWVSANYFGVTGTRFAAGRSFVDSEQPHAEIVISHRYWQRRFHGESVVGQAILLNNQPVTIVGVTEPGFTGSTVLAADVWAPLPLLRVFHPQSHPLDGRQNAMVMGIGRLKPGTTPQQAQADLQLVAQRLAQEFPDTHAERGVAVSPSTRFPGDTRMIAATFLGVLGLLTLLGALVASANIAGLLLARGAVRQQEYAIRAALGADRRRLLVGLLAENLVLFALGGAAGALLCVWLINLLRGAIPQLPVPVEFAVSVDPLSLAFAVGLALLLGLVFSLGPALSSSRFDLLSALRQQPGQAGSGRVFGLRGLFLLFQLTLSLALLTTAAGLAKSLWTLAYRSPGFDSTRVELAQMDLGNAGLNAASGRTFAEQLLDGARRLPAVEAAALATSVPLDGGGRGFGRLALPGEPDGSIDTDWNLVSAGYFQTLGIPLLRGRDFTAADRAGAPLVAIVNETFARRTWPNEEALGKILLNDRNQPVEIVGVARDAKYRSAGEAPRAHFYAPFGQVYFSQVTLFVKSRDGATLVPAVRELVKQLQPNLPVFNTQTLASAVSGALTPQRIAAGVALAAGLLALVLAATGIYGVTLFWATLRTREFGVRLALGATPGSLLRLALGGSLRLAAASLVLGFGVAFALLQAVNAVFGGIGADPLLFIASGGFFTALVVAAAFFPARRAARVDPMIALRAE